jgi:hypothetical protein
MALFRKSAGRVTILHATLPRHTRRAIHRNAKATASRSWLPTDSQPEPHWVTEWDGQIKAAIVSLIGDFEMDTISELQTIARFNDMEGLEQPHRVERTHESRREHGHWQEYRTLRQAAVEAIVLYDQRRERLMRDIDGNIDVNLAGRGMFYGKLSEYHPRPAEVRDIDGTPINRDTDFGLKSTSTLNHGKALVDTARAKLDRESGVVGSDQQAEHRANPSRDQHLRPVKKSSEPADDAMEM